VLDLVGDVAHDHRVRHREVVSGEDRVDDPLLELATLVLGAPRLELSAQLGAERREARELAERLRELVVQRRSTFSFTSTSLTSADPPRPRSSSRRWSSAKRNGT